MADQCFIGDGNAGVADAGPLPRVGGVTSQAGVAWIGGPETGLNIGDAGWHATNVPAVAADPANGVVAVGEHYTRLVGRLISQFQEFAKASFK